MKEGSQRIPKEFFEDRYNFFSADGVPKAPEEVQLDKVLDEKEKIEAEYSDPLREVDHEEVVLQIDSWFDSASAQEATLPEATA
jgi:hypothetical protein